MSLITFMQSFRRCDVCGVTIGLFKKQKLKRGKCCPDCRAKLSPWFTGLRHATAEDIRAQIECRRMNALRLDAFSPTRRLGARPTLWLDDAMSAFALCREGTPKAEGADVIALSDVLECTVTAVEHREEIKFRDNNDELRSFKPPCFACAYDFWVEIHVNVPYIGTLKYKLNETPVDNGQPTCVDMQWGGALGKAVGKLVDRVLAPPRSFMGKASNADEVRACAEYRRYEALAGDIKQAFAPRPAPRPDPRPDPRDPRRHCPWCGVRVLPSAQGRCPNCNGYID